MFRLASSLKNNELARRDTRARPVGRPHAVSNPENEYLSPAMRPVSCGWQAREVYRKQDVVNMKKNAYSVSVHYGAKCTISDHKNLQAHHYGALWLPF